MDDPKRLAVVFFRTPVGSEPVREWLKELPAEDRQIVGRDLRLVEIGWPLGMPLCKPLGNGLWEVRSRLTSNRIARVIFCAEGGYMILLHGFVKKSQKTPAGALQLAARRKAEIKT